VTQLAVNRFEAQLLNTKNLLYDLKQKRIQTENKINFLLGRFPQPIDRPKVSVWDIDLKPIQAGIPAQLLQNRPDIQQRELELAAAKLDVKIAKANFYPSLRIISDMGSQGFNPKLAFRPEGILFGLAGELISPLVNRNVLVANYKTATAKQLQAIIRYEQTVLNAYIEVANQLAQVDNYTQSFQTKQKQVDILTQSIQVANNLFNAARADYVEVLLTQREALEAKIELIEIKLKQIKAFIYLYRALGGGWR
ncbi:MAG: TolC family protein, partial [Bacteroidia bacterium]|nr:TolC family protein [Bacteroidia bacterium]